MMTKSAWRKRIRAAKKLGLVTKQIRKDAFAHVSEGEESAIKEVMMLGIMKSTPNICQCGHGHNEHHQAANVAQHREYRVTVCNCSRVHFQVEPK
jgi:hypothetical protein